MNKRKIKQIFALCLTLALSMIFVLPCAVKANLNTRTTMTIKANVPNDFEQEIGVDLIDEVGITFTAFLTKENGYTESITVPSHRTFDTKVSFPNGEEHATNVKEQYVIKDESKYSITFDVMTYSSKKEVEKGKVSYELEIAPETGIAKPEDVINQFRERVAFMENNPNFKDLFDMYTSFEPRYLESNPNNTKEKWANMSDIERFTYYVTVTEPTNTIMKEEYADFENVEAELWAEKSLLENRKDGNKVYDAIVDVWKWQHEYWKQNMTTYDFFNEENTMRESSSENESDSQLTDKDKEELEQIRSEIGEDEYLEIQKEINGKEEKKGAPIIIVLFAIGIGGVGLLTALVVLFFYYKKKKD